ncbi:MAG TPA: mycofactocin-coupled SDR family oxidoreductase [Nocardioides sp.]|nr:mycofactocin-coupled SDR family oxidoreductase [Nocardioides sp.]
MRTVDGVDRVALVTGAARGIGAATARRLALAGTHVVAVDWCVGADGPAAYPQATPADLDALVAELPEGRVLPVVGDVRDPAALVGAVALAQERWGRLDAVVAAAALVAGGRPLWEETDLDLLWDVDVRGVWNAAAAAVPVMLAGPDPSGCRFVAVASAAGDQGLHRLAAYSTVKHAVVGLAKGLAADLVGTGVTACAVSPGSTDTAMLAATADLYGVTTTELAERQFLRRVLEPDEVAAAIVFACSPEGAVLNGSVLAADGGFQG